MFTADCRRHVLTLCVAIAVPFLLPAGGQVHAQDPAAPTAPVELTAQQDHRRILDLLGITSLRPGPSGRAAAACSPPSKRPTYRSPMPEPGCSRT